MKKGRLAAASLMLVVALVSDYAKRRVNPVGNRTERIPAEIQKRFPNGVPAGLVGPLRR